MKDLAALLWSIAFLAARAHGFAVGRQRQRQQQHAAIETRSHRSLTDFLHVSRVLSSSLGASRSKGNCGIASMMDVYQLEREIDATLAAKQDPVPLLEQLEACNTCREPNRSPEFLGEWHVWWTNCPPPSNGQLGPFKGTSGQIIQDASASASTATFQRQYQNVLKVPPNDWLVAKLDGIYEDWDGTILIDTKKDNAATNGNICVSNATTTAAAAATSGRTLPVAPKEDWGAKHWKVTFVRLNFFLFGMNVFGFDFPPNTSRVWRTTYLGKGIGSNYDGTTTTATTSTVRIVRAGRTGLPDSESIFYTKRQPSPFSLY